VTGVAAGAAVGLLAGGGMALAGGRLPVLHRPRLEDRLAPYLRDSTGRRGCSPGTGP
jgi:tight adherence protein C